MKIHELVRLIVLLFKSTSTVALLRRRQQQQQRQTIVGGSQITDRSRFPFLAFSSGDRSCSATLIWNDILLSAGHCQEAFLKLGVRIGGIEEKGNDGEYHDVEQVLVHPDYPVASTQPYDIMLVKISSYSSIQPATIASSLEQPDFGSSVKILGYGLESEDGAFSPYAKEVDVSVVNFTSCDDLYGGKLLENVQFCTESTNGDSCQGDSGGPLLNESGEQVGIVAFGEGCHRYPSVNTRVSHFAPWILEGVCALSSDPPSACFTAPILPPPVTSTTNSNPLLSEEEGVSSTMNDTTVPNTTWSKTTSKSDRSSGSTSSLFHYSLLRRRGIVLLLGSFYVIMG